MAPTGATLGVHVEVRNIERGDRAARFGLEWREDGKRRRRFFPSEAERDIARAEVCSKLAAYGAADPVPVEDLVLLRRCREILGPGTSLIEACRFYARNHAEIRRTGMAEAVELFLIAQQGAGVAEATVRNLECTLNRLVDSVGKGVPVSEVERRQVESMVSSLPYEAVTRNDYRKRIRKFFRYCVSQRWTTSNPADGVAAAKVLEAEVEVMPVDDVAALMAHAWANRPVCCAYYALGFFGGLRTSSICRLSLAEIDFGQRGILLPGDKHKTGRRHYVEGFPANLWRWLEAVRDRCGEEAFTVSARQWNSKRTEVASAAGIAMPHNAMRHSFASYHIALEGNAERTASLLTHRGTGILYRHYRGKATRADARRYFSIAPQGTH